MISESDKSKLHEFVNNCNSLDELTKHINKLLKKNNLIGIEYIARNGKIGKISAIIDGKIHLKFENHIYDKICHQDTLNEVHGDTEWDLIERVKVDPYGGI